MSGRADAVCGSSRVDALTCEPSSGVGPASTSARGAATTAWSHTSLLVLGALPTAPSCARLHAGAILHEWGLGDVAETAELVISELVTNAVQASTNLPVPRHLGLPVIHLRLIADQHEIVIEVWDSNPHAPDPKPAAPDEEHGRGLMLVDALCERWGSEAALGRGGKMVWAELAVS